MPCLLVRSPVPVGAVMSIDNVFYLDPISGERLSKYTITYGAIRKVVTIARSTRLRLPHGFAKFARYDFLSLFDCAVAPKVLYPYPSWLPHGFAFNVSI